MNPPERVTITNRRGQRLAGLCQGGYAPNMAILCHGMLSGKNGTKHQLLADVLAKRGVSSLRFDFAGRGESEGSLVDLTYSSEVEDLISVFGFLGDKGVERFGLFGSSMGGAIAYLAAAREERVTAIVTLAAVGHPNLVEERYAEHMADWRERGYIELPEGRLGIGFVDDALLHDVIAAVGVLRAPVLVIHGEDDEVVPVADAHDIATAARVASLEIVDDADHRFSDPVHREPTIERVADFLAGHLEKS